MPSSSPTVEVPGAVVAVVVAVVVVALVVLMVLAAVSYRRWLAVRRGVAALTEAAEAMPWPASDILADLCARAQAATGSPEVSVLPPDRADAGPHVVVVPIDARRVLQVRRPVRARWGAPDPREILAALVGMARASEEAALREAVLRQQVHVDALTGLWSYPRFRDSLRQLAAQCPPEQAWGVLFLDLDHFKSINTRLGHLEADEVLRQVSRRLADGLDASMIAGRFGGDEFLVGARIPQADPERLATLVNRLTARIRQPMRIGEQLLQVNVSVGAAQGRDGDDIDAVIRQAEAAMRAAKRVSTTHGPPRWADQRRKVRELLDDREIRVEYQPVIDVQTQRIAGFEALLRVTDPEMGVISPETMVDAAARIRLLDELTLMVSEQALEAMQQLAPHCSRRLRLALNIEFEQLRSDNVTLSWLVERFEEAPVDLLLEITERSSLQWTQAHEQVAIGLRRQGIELAVDDFGAGYATYRFLDAWDWSLVKIDKGLVNASDRYGQLLLRHVAGLLADLNIDAVVEGIEGSEHWDLIAELGLRYAQGYHTGRPMTAAAALDLAEQGWLERPISGLTGRLG
ncbi:MAG: bifunctional diguanylate cyclase/phosphodiesterase [Austwickia sp.]|nr:bifunctional diguanylate cyclase/phosphodiesterase [Austwickia sp.]